MNLRPLMRFLFRGETDRLVADVSHEHKRLSHCHRCGRCICYQHSALSDDTWEEHRTVCRRCAA